MNVTRMNTDKIMILVDKDSGAVRLVTLDLPRHHPRLLRDYPGCAGIRGDLARVLYEVLAGHDYVADTPADADMGRARAALGVLLKMDDDPNFSVAFRALRAAGGKLMPWLGVTRLDEQGFIVDSAKREVSVI